ncbi:hypothetical protein PVT67_04770 [Gallaecimonas kandeliae]|uniref:hypothetical protein n=1 Tax=Gallaecimonas kandeliae TaxID=3029055 RepID=UPI002648AA32|nr:hypothetical protein [Gallaecimonas kandeliae]WKE66567.1 hypothetical protein PVT67_04770 [Gallaecimonas kandeliae]
MKFPILLLALLAGPALADDQSQCTENAGSYLTGTVIKAPYFTKGHRLHGVELSHTHLKIKADQDGQPYDVAIDNVFADGYVKNEQQVPAPLNGIQAGDRLELCGQLYSEGGGIHWVHTNCGATPTPAKPNGWVKKFMAGGTTSDNFEDLTTYCHLWPN